MKKIILSLMVIVVLFGGLVVPQTDAGAIKTGNCLPPLNNGSQVDTEWRADYEKCISDYQAGQQNSTKGLNVFTFISIVVTMAGIVFLLNRTHVMKRNNPSMVAFYIACWIAVGVGLTRIGLVLASDLIASDLSINNILTNISGLLYPVYLASLAFALISGLRAAIKTKKERVGIFFLIFIMLVFVGFALYTE